MPWLGHNFNKCEWRQKLSVETLIFYRQYFSNNNSEGDHYHNSLVLLPVSPQGQNNEITRLIYDLIESYLHRL